MEITSVDSEAAPSLENKNKAIVNTLYRGLSSGDTATVAGHIATDLEWWYHGPQNRHHMMKMLTGKCSTTAFKFEPQSIDAIDECVIVEGWEGAQSHPLDLTKRSLPGLMLAI
ncbi:Hypothetical predicted protein [Olea europaea subsp. europaea]|uniref:SnoaL-like domain-containing protein n=1 Tax=Olea europaea subsp. europaea TaxID=158383 RepID=A0A8S0PZ99_OLEEU|nr:Hypothetical predicted protein [Olea europaea subsp. europaea]